MSGGCIARLDPLGGIADHRNPVYPYVPGWLCRAGDQSYMETVRRGPKCIRRTWLVRLVSRGHYDRRLGEAAREVNPCPIRRRGCDTGLQFQSTDSARRGAEQHHAPER